MPRRRWTRDHGHEPDPWSSTGHGAAIPALVRIPCSGKEGWNGTEAELQSKNRRRTRGGAGAALVRYEQASASDDRGRGRTRDRKDDAHHDAPTGEDLCKHGGRWSPHSKMNASPSTREVSGSSVFPGKLPTRGPHRLATTHRDVGHAEIGAKNVGRETLVDITRSLATAASPV